MGISAVSSIQQRIAYDVKEIEMLIDGVKKTDAKDTVRKLKDELIQYILANMCGDKSLAEAIGKEIASTIQTYENNIQNANGLDNKVKSIEGNPSDQTSGEENSLQKLIAILKQDVLTGDTNNWNF